MCFCVVDVPKEATSPNQQWQLNTCLGYMIEISHAMPMNWGGDHSLI
jgi:hypothetical protein